MCSYHLSMLLNRLRAVYLYYAQPSRSGILGNYSGEPSVAAHPVLPGLFWIAALAQDIGYPIALGVFFQLELFCWHDADCLVGA
jgi:hypothetical protein